MILNVNSLFDFKKGVTEFWKYFSNIFGDKYIILVILITNISHLIAGFSFAWSSPSLVKLNETENNPLGKPITPHESDLIGSFFYIGASVGPLLFIWSLEKLGRKPTIILMGMPLPIVYGIFAIARDIKIYYICRIVTGLVISGICSYVPVYTSEILPTNTRGSLMSLSNSFIQGGSLLAYIIGPHLSNTFFNFIIAFLSLSFLVSFLLSCPESPYFTMKIGRKSDSKEILECLRNEKCDAELAEVEKIVEDILPQTFFNIFSCKQNIKAFSMATIILVVQQFTGITMVMGYSQLIFLETNITISSETCSVIVGGLQVTSSFIAPLLSEKFCRKTMLYFSLLGLSVCNFLIFLYFHSLKENGTVDWLPLVILTLFVVLDNCGNGPIPWVILGEIYPLEIKSVGPAVSTAIYYSVQFLLTFSFNKIEQQYMFLFYFCCCILGTIFVRFCIAETQGKSLKEIRDSLGK